MQVGTSPNSGAFVFVMALPAGPLQEAAVEAFGIGSLPAPGEIVLSKPIAAEVKAEEGDLVFIGTRSFEIAAVSSLVEGAFSSAAAVNAQDADELFGHPGAFSYALVTTAPDTDPAIVESAIESGTPGINALTPAQFAAVTRSQVEEEFLPVVTVILGVAFVVGLAVIALTIYTSTVERSRDYGVLKAVGASTGQLFAMVIRQSVTVALVGFVVGLLLGFGAGVFIEEIVPEFATLYRWQDLLFVLGAALLMSAVAAFVPFRRVARIDPATVFRA